MALRTLEIIAPSESGGIIRKALSEHRPIDSWSIAETEEGGRRVVIRALVDPDFQQDTLDALHDALTGSEGWRIVIHPVDAALPRPDPDEEQDALRERRKRTATREVLYAQIEKGAGVNADYLLFVVLSTIVAGAALVTNNVAVLVGAMVIAPFLGPNLAFAFAAALGDKELMQRAAWSLFVGFAIALALSVFAGAAMPIDLEAKELTDRTRIGLDGLAVALASGACAALALTSGANASLIGVMVAVALLPPAVTIGIMLGAGRLAASLGAAELFLVNVISVNLSALAVFRWRGIEPRRWLQKYEARQSRRAAFLVLGALIVILGAAILLQGYRS